ncbi:phage head closure protein [Robbsia sp. Bb-Pol-6]|uniref:Phage head closure protein n=1 Tax=Robbsia betulipollinis TaxID=2981849 RepID=A0ABT3ZI51_9BURK|nr:phage head closure protein [Robbsia betulipollinis]MCY0385653.1 phage head closure protein [Robbsia betulipollinis]
MRAGTLNRLVEIQQPGDVKDKLGQPVPGWVRFARPWANIRTVNGREYAAADSERSEVTTSIQIRYRDDITTSMRVVHRGVVYKIHAVLPDEAGRECVYLACSNGGSNG